ncbi:hypothetical protein D3C76_1006640 [compost metagenome]
MLRQLFGQHHRQAVGFFARRAACRPDAYLVTLWPQRFEQARYDIALQRLEGFAVAKEIGHADQHVAQQFPGFLRMSLQVLVIGGQIRLRGHLQAPLDAAQHRRALVVLEVMASACPQL